MKLPASILLFLAAASAFAHPGHGEPGLLHTHGEWIVLAVALLVWRALRR